MLTNDRNTARREGDFYYLPMAANVRIFADAMVAINAAGCAIPAANVAGVVGAGRAEEHVNNIGGDAGDKSKRVRRGVFLFVNDAEFPLTLADIGRNAYISDDETVRAKDVTPGAANPVAGKVVEVTASGVWVDTTGKYSDYLDTLADAVRHYFANHVQTGVLIQAPTTASAHDEADAGSHTFRVNVTAGVVVVNGVVADIAAEADRVLSTAADAALLGAEDTHLIAAVVAAEEDGVVTLVNVLGEAAPEDKVAAPTDAEITTAVGHANWIRLGHTMFARTDTDAITQTYDNTVRPCLV